MDRTAPTTDQPNLELDVASAMTARRATLARFARTGGAVALLAFGLAATDAGAATILVANTGADAPACGGDASPCRTITQAVAVASNGDRIVVLPGVYGDVDGDGEQITPGDEPWNDDCECLVAVNKSVTIVSEGGAGATILRGAVDGQYAVRIDAPNVVLGKKKKGFSIVGDPQHDGYGVRIGGNASGTRVEGNVFSRLENGIWSAGDGAAIVGNRISQVFGQGIHAEGQGVRILANVVEQTGTLGGNDSAIHVVGTGNAGHTIARNLVVGNFGLGIFVDNGSGASVGQPHVVSDNLVVGNGKAGVKVVLASNSGSVTVTENSIYNNDNEAGTNCGLMTLSAGPVINATNNYWGGAGGPGANPKDDVCSVGTPPDFGGAAATAFRVVAPPMR